VRRIDDDGSRVFSIDECVMHMAQTGAWSTLATIERPTPTVRRSSHATADLSKSEKPQGRLAPP
jgi:hypothetical protein